MTPTPTPRQYRAQVQHQAEAQLIEILGTREGKAASARVGLAFAAAARAAKKPEVLYQCSPESVGTAVAMSALTGLMPGGPHPAVWLVPKRSHGTWHMQWWLSHRGIATLALRHGYQVMAVPVALTDHLEIEFGEVVAHTPNGDYPEDLAELAGVYLTIRTIETGVVLCRPWMPLAAIEQRRRKALTDDIWQAWPLEMAAKTALHWAMARGMLPIEGLDLEAALAHEHAQVEAADPKQLEQDPEPDPTDVFQRPAFVREREREKVPAEAAEQPEVPDAEEAQAPDDWGV